jgi:hypothetical protein
MCAGCTLAALLPAAMAEARAPSAQGLLRCMATSAFAFFLFAYQVGPAAARAPHGPRLPAGRRSRGHALAPRLTLPSDYLADAWVCMVLASSCMRA